MTPTLSPGLLFALLCSLIFVPGPGFAQAVREAYVKASNTDAFDGFGSSVAISGTTAVAGALFESSSATGVNGSQADNSADVAGAAYVFVRGASTWTQQAYLKASNTDSFDGFGRVVAISGDTIAVGARGESSAATGVNGNQADNSAVSSGAVYIFVRSGSIWTQQAYIKASDTVAGQRFGSAVSLDGDVLAVGANSLSGAPGAVYVFRRNGTTWAQEARLQPLDVAAQGPGGLQARDFGNTLSISGDFIVVPAPTHTNALQSDGVVYVFRRNTGVWAQEAMLNANPSPVRGMSDKVSISGSTLAVGSTNYQTGNGVSTPITTTYGAYLFTRSGTGWTQQGHIQEDQLTPNSASAAGMAMQGDVLLLGGAERVWNYVRSGTTWIKTATFDALDASRSDAFGRNLAVSGGRGIIAAPNEDSTTIGINGLEGGIGATQSGAVYLYSGLGPQSALELTVTVDPAATAICKEATLTMTLRNQGQQVITSIEAPAGLVPVGNIVAGISQVQSPPGLFSLTAGQTKVLTWKIMGTKAGTAAYDIRYQGRLNGAELVQSAIIRTPAVVFSGLELEVNSTGDEADADLSDNCPDVDLARPGLQSTLRSVLQTVNATTLPAGQRARVSFAIPGTGVPRISPRTLLPPVTKPVEILGNTQAGGWVELNGTLVSSPGDGLEVRSASTIRGLVVNGWKRAALVLTGTGGNEVLGCRLGTDAAGATAIPNGFGVVVLSPDNVVGGTGSLGNLISGNLVSGVSLEKLTTGGLPNGNRIIGNRIGTSADGTQTVLQKNGIVVANGADNLIGESGLGNLISGHKLVGVSIEGADSKGNQIQANLVGTTADGSAALPNNIGIALSKGASANTIGGDASTLGNLISGNNASGVLVAEAAFSNKIQGNLIGLNRSGTLALANVMGVYIEDGTSNRIGGGIVSHKNIISGNTSAGITLSNSKGAVPQQRSCNGTIIEGNWIGLSKDGLHTVPNGGPMPLSNAGIVLNYYAQNTTIGGPLPGQGNVISGNDGFGVVINSGPALTNTVQGNTIGLLPDGITPAGNSGSGFGTATGSSAQTIIGGSSTGAGNRIAYNGGHGVDLRGTSRSVPSPVQANHIFLNKGRAIALADRRPLNDNGDADTGPNGLQNFPFLRTARNLSGATVVLMDLKTFPLNKSFRIDFFHHRDGDPQSGGDAWINSISILTGTAADALYTASLPLQFSSFAITCTATDVAGNTSEYSNAVIVSAATDRDHDGIPDDQETAGGKVPARTRSYSVGDANGDGVADADQANVSTMLLPDTGWVCLAGPAGSTLTNMAITDYASYARLPAPWQTKREIVTFNMAGAPAGTTTLTWIEAPGSEVHQIWRWTGSAWLSASPVITVDDANGTKRFTVTLPTPAGTQLVSLARAYLPPPLPVLSISSNSIMVPAAQQQGGVSLSDFTSYLNETPAGPAPVLPSALVPATTVILLLTPPADGVIQWSRDLGATEEWQDIFPAARLTQGRYKFVFPNSEPHGFFRLRSLEH